MNSILKVLSQGPEDSARSLLHAAAAERGVRNALSGISTSPTAPAAAELHTHTCLRDTVAPAAAELHTHTCLRDTAAPAAAELHTHTCLRDTAAPAAAELHTHTCLRDTVAPAAAELHTHTCLRDRAAPAAAELHTHTCLRDSIHRKSSDRRATASALQIDPSAASEFLQMIQSARNSDEQNLEAYVKNGHLSFRAIKDIPENTELLAWYGRDLAMLLNLNAEQKKKKGFICSTCKQSFLFELPLLAHQRFFCTEKSQCFSKKFAFPEMHSLSSKPTTNFHNLARELENCGKARPADAKNTKRRRSLESDTDESDGEPSSFDMHEKVSVKRFCVNGVNGHSWLSASKKSFSEGRNSQFSPTQSHDNSTTDPNMQDLKPITIATKPSFTGGLCDVPDDKDRKSAFTQPPRITPQIPLMSVILTNNTTPTRSAILPRILPLNIQGSASLYKDLPKQLSLLPSANLWPKTFRLQQPRATHSQSLLQPSLPSLGLPVQNWCAKCNISFHMTSDLVQHMRSHHKRAMSDEKQPRHRDEKLKCPICKEAFRERHHLSRHMNSHA